MEKIGLLGGTFNPIHYGHIAVAESVYNNLKLDKVIFLPCSSPPHKNNKIIPFEDRIKMIELSLKKHKNFSVSSKDFNDFKPSYTQDLIKKLKKENSDNEYYFIIGFDNIIELPTWKNWEWLLDNIQFVAVTRAIKESIKNDIPYMDKIIIVKMSPVNISSSHIRERLKNNLSIDNYIDPAINPFINKYKNILTV